MPVVIVRPSIVVSSYREPAPGWIDSLAAAGAFVHAVGAGMSSHMQGIPNIAFDVIPVDYVSNAILVATALQANRDEFQIVHSCSSDRNVLRIKDLFIEAVKFARLQPFDNQWYTPTVVFHPKGKMYDVSPINCSCRTTFPTLWQHSTTV